MKLRYSIFASVLICGCADGRHQAKSAEAQKSVSAANQCPYGSTEYCVDTPMGSVETGDVLVGFRGTVTFNHKVVLTTEDPYPEGSFVFLEHRVESKASLIVVAERSSAPTCEYRKIHFVLLDGAGGEKVIPWDGECLDQNLSTAFRFKDMRNKWHFTLVDSAGNVSEVELWKARSSHQ